MVIPRHGQWCLSMARTLRWSVPERTTISSIAVTTVGGSFSTSPSNVSFTRPVLAEMEYMAGHDGQRPSDPALLKPYLAKPLNELRLLRNMRLTIDGERVKMNLNFNGR